MIVGAPSLLSMIVGAPSLLTEEKPVFNSAFLSQKLQVHGSTSVAPTTTRDASASSAAAETASGTQTSSNGSSSSVARMVGSRRRVCLFQ
jgi:hypothetical protein